MKKKHTSEPKPIPTPTLSGYTWIFTILSFFGWCFEKAGRLWLYPGDPIRDRGFLSLPFCTIYGTCVVLIGFLLGAPNAPSRWMKKIYDRFARLPRWLSWVLRILLYFLAAMVLASAVELVAGGLFRLAGVQLWNYSERWGNLWGLICPSYSLLWGALITILMSLIWKPCCALVSYVPRKVRVPVAWVMVCVLMGDFLFNCGYVLLTGSRFYIW